MTGLADRASKAIKAASGVDVDPDLLGVRGGGQILPRVDDDLQVDTVAWVEEESDRFELLSSFKLAISGGRKEETAEFCRGVNDALLVSSLELEDEQAETEVRFSTALAKASTKSDSTLEQTVKGHLDSYEALMPIVAAVARDGLDSEAARSSWREAIDRYKLGKLIR